MKPVTIYTWTMCPFCVKAKRLLDQKGVTYEEIIIDGDSDALEIGRASCRERV